MIDIWRLEGHAIGLLLILSGLMILTKCIYDFHKTGKGTLVPWAPAQKLVIVGLYKYSRNPMYIGVFLIVLGLAIFCGSFLTIFYAFLLLLAFHIRILKHEEPSLENQFSNDRKKYSGQVPRWIPKIAL